ncbi:MAG: endolytic transglycosylase MltG [Gemmobacter sp.]|nr:endolytic transglycosylase MltG [Gemmobacter sp.]
MWKAIASNALTLLIVLMVAAAGLLAWGKAQYSAPGPLTEAICLRVDRGSSFSAVSRALETQGAVTDARIFRIGADYTDKAKGLKFGSYLVPAGASMVQIVDIITRGGQSTCGSEINFRIGVAGADVVLRELDAATNRYVEVVKFDPSIDAAPAEYLEAVADNAVRLRITLAEGVTSWQVLDSLKRADFLTGEVSGVPAEGTLAPDSYEVVKGASRAPLIAEMTERQERVLADLWASRADGLPYATPQEALIMASIVEKETGVPDERGQVASVFVNRLRQNMKLQTDPTVIYGVTKGQGVLGRGLRQSELRAATPWNTYVIDGLPPTPIANPGRDSIEAALNPDDTPFVFFVADGTGGHAFAVTLADHNANVAKWRQIEAERARQQPAPTGN